VCVHRRLPVGQGLRQQQPMLQQHRVQHTPAGRDLKARQQRTVGCVGHVQAAVAAYAPQIMEGHAVVAHPQDDIIVYADRPHLQGRSADTVGQVL
jgi:hypothetical protein